MLAQAPDGDLLTLAAWGTVFVGALVVLVLGVCMARRWFLGEQPANEWTLQDLRDMRDRGEIDASQYEHLRVRVIGGRMSGGGDGTVSSTLDETDGPGETK